MAANAVKQINTAMVSASKKDQKKPRQRDNERTRQRRHGSDDGRTVVVVLKSE